MNEKSEKYLTEQEIRTNLDNDLVSQHKIG